MDPRDHLSFAVLMAESVISPNRDALVLGLEVFGSNYGAAETYIFEAYRRSLTERYPYRECIHHIRHLPHIPLKAGGLLSQLRRIPVLVDKWHAPEYYTLSWNGTGWDFVGDGYFTDAETVTVTGGRVLTLAAAGGPPAKQFGPRLIYDQIQVFDGDMMFNPDMLLQTIVPEEYPGGRPLPGSDLPGRRLPLCPDPGHRLRRGRRNSPSPATRPKIWRRALVPLE